MAESAKVYSLEIFRPARVDDPAFFATARRVARAAFKELPPYKVVTLNPPLVEKTVSTPIDVLPYKIYDDENLFLKLLERSYENGDRFTGKKIYTTQTALESGVPQKKSKRSQLPPTPAIKPYHEKLRDATEKYEVSPRLNVNIQCLGITCLQDTARYPNTFLFALQPKTDDDTYTALMLERVVSEAALKQVSPVVYNFNNPQTALAIPFMRVNIDQPAEQRSEFIKQFEASNLFPLDVELGQVRLNIRA